jgi:SAM-dependent methyltransferase
VRGRSLRAVISLDTLRATKRLADRLLSSFVALEAVEKGALNSRLLEYPFVLQQLVGLPPGRVLDIGCTDNGNILAPTLATLGWHVYGVDIREWRYTHPNFSFAQVDLSKGSGFDDAFFDCVYAISSIEHFGLRGRYGVMKDEIDADLAAVREVRRILRPGGQFFVTVPYGRGGLIRPIQRVYDFDRLRMVVQGWGILHEHYHQLDRNGVWHEVSEESARATGKHGSAVAMLTLVNGPLPSPCPEIGQGGREEAIR